MSEKSGKATIQIKNLTKYYGKYRGIEDVSLTINSGSIYGFLGPNGAGKTTTIRCLLGILKPDSGSIAIFGRHIKNWNNNIELKEDIGYLPGEFDLYNHFTVKKVLDYFASLRKKPSKLRAELVEYFDLDESRKVNELSKGNKQKAGLIQALMHDPNLLILDEPTGGLDPLVQQRLYKLLKEYQARGKTIFCSSHNLSEVQKLCDEVAIIRDGFIVSHSYVDHLSNRIQQRIDLTSNTSLDNILPQISAVSHYKPLQSNGDIYRYSIILKAVDSNLSKLFQALDSYSLTDIVIPEPNLEDYFLQYYSDSR
jgi:ABC-2 type transport system ATP-binding protein